MDDFGIKLFSDADKDHLIDSLRKYYSISIDKEGKNCCGLTIDWHYADDFVDICIPGFVPKALEKFQHVPPARPQYAPHQWNRPAYRKKMLYAPPLDASKKLDKKVQHLVQSIVGTFMHCGRAIESP
eukprot:5696564-Ditylum_brightwellii.AAC.1